MEEGEAGGEKGKKEEGHEERKAWRKKGMMGISASSSTGTSPRVSSWAFARIKHVKKDVE